MLYILVEKFFLSVTIDASLFPRSIVPGRATTTVMCKRNRPRIYDCKHIY